MSLAGAAVLIAALGGAAQAGTQPKGQGRSPQALTRPADPAMEPLLNAIKKRMPRLDSVTAAHIQVPARAIELGSRSRMYRCWRLRLTGDHGKKAVRVFERLHSVQAALRDQRAKLTKDLLLYTEGSEPTPGLADRIRARSRSLDSLLESYDQLIAVGLKSKLLKKNEKSFISGRSTILPILKENDYTMVYDDGSPECRK